MVVYAYATYSDRKGEMVYFFFQNEIEDLGGIEGLEAMLREEYAWFAPLGTLRAKSARRGTKLSVKAVSKLVRAWEAQGSPKQVGKTKAT